MKKYISWNEVEAYVNEVCKRYNNDSLTGVFGLPRGGVVLAVMISHKLNIPMLLSPIENSLIIDDICDSGESLLHYERNSSAFKKPLYHITTMMYKKGAIVTPEYYYGIKEDDWIVFPWEVK